MAMRRALTLGTTAALLSASPAWAAAKGFPDVKTGHWAAPAVEEMAVKRTLMRAFADGTFRGEQPLTRVQLAQSLDSLLWDLEGIAKTSWVPDTPANRYPLTDVTGVERRTVVKLVNRYRLWDGVPGVTPERFEPNAQVSRSEMAHVVKNLLERGEAKGVVRPVNDRSTGNPYQDLVASEWAYRAILANTSRYRVMVGFPDHNFKPKESLTRYQYAAVGSASFPLVRELVRRSVKQRDLERTTAAPIPQSPNAFQEVRPYSVSLGVPALAGPLGLAANARVIGYPTFGAGNSWFALADLNVGIIPALGASMTLGAFPKLPALGLPGIGSLHLQPYVGIAPYVDGVRGVGIALPAVGGISYLRTGPFGIYAMASATPATIDSRGINAGLTTGLSLGGEYVLAPSLSLLGGVGLAGTPTGLALAPTLGVSWGM